MTIGHLSREADKRQRLAPRKTRRTRRRRSQIPEYHVAFAFLRVLRVLRGESLGFSVIEYADIAWNGQRAHIEYEWVGAGDPVIVFLHEGLGSRSMWRDFPRRLCEAAGARGLVYSRPGFGRSTPRPRFGQGYLHEEAHGVLPAFLAALGLGGERLWLFGHSDGASIALLYAARFPEAVSGIAVVAPHIFVEDVTRDGLRNARIAYETTSWRERLARY